MIRTDTGHHYAPTDYAPMSSAYARTLYDEPLDLMPGSTLPMPLEPVILPLRRSDPDEIRAAQREGARMASQRPNHAYHTTHPMPLHETRSEAVSRIGAEVIGWTVAVPAVLLIGALYVQAGAALLRMLGVL